MSEKQPSQTLLPSAVTEPGRPRYVRQPGSFRSRVALLCPLLVLVFLYSVWISDDHSEWKYGLGCDCPKGDLVYIAKRLLKSASREDGGVSGSKHRRIPLEAHIMSKCPDAKDCLHDLVLPAMQRTQDKVDFKLSYIGEASPNDDTISCMHGPAECLGDMVELCAADEYPDPKIYLGFTMCLTREYERIPERSLVEDCALEHGIVFEKLNECVSRDDGGYVVGLLRDSVERSERVGVRTSCTIRLDEEVRCVRDGGQWKDCDNGHTVDDLVRDVEKLYNNTSVFD